MYMYIYIYYFDIFTTYHLCHMLHVLRTPWPVRAAPRSTSAAPPTPTRSPRLKIHQRGVQGKHGVVIYMMLHTILSYNTTPIHCTPLPLHPLLRNAQRRRLVAHATAVNPRSENLDFGGFDTARFSNKTIVNIWLPQGGEFHLRPRDWRPGDVRVP